MAAAPPAPQWRLALVALAVAVAILKPWSGLAGGPGGGPAASGSAPLSPPAVALAASPTASPAPTATPDPNAVPCLDPDGWRLVTFETTPGRATRTWLVVAPVAARGPTDPAIVSVALTTKGLAGIGLCAPASGRQAVAWSATPLRIAAAWRLDGPPGSPVAQPLGLVALDPAPGPASGGYGTAALLYGIQGTLRHGSLKGLGQPGAWPPGRYVLAVRPPTPATGLEEWFGVTLATSVP